MFDEKKTKIITFHEDITFWDADRNEMQVSRRCCSTLMQHEAIIYLSLAVEFIRVERLQFFSCSFEVFHVLHCQIYFGFNKFWSAKFHYRQLGLRTAKFRNLSDKPGRAFLWSALNWKLQNLRAMQRPATGNKYFECCSVHKAIEEAQKQKSVIKCHKECFSISFCFFLRMLLCQPFAKKNHLDSTHLLFPIMRPRYFVTSSHACMHRNCSPRTQNPLCA